MVKYLSLAEIRKDISSLPATWFSMPTADDTVHIGKLDDQSNLKFRVIIGEDMCAKLFIHGLQATKTPLEVKSLRAYLNEVSQSSECPGVTEASLQDYAPLPGPATAFYRYIINKRGDTGTSHTSTVRAADCTLITEPTNLVCSKCREVRRKLEARQKHQTVAASKPLHPNTPLRHVANTKLANAEKQLRRKENELQREIAKMKEELEVDAVEVPEGLHNELKQAVEQGNITNPMAELFWKEQLKAFKTADHGIRWHPMMIRLAILLRCQSPAAYATLRDTGVLKLPGDSTLKDYTSAIHPKEGFNPSVHEELHNMTKDLPDHKRYVVLLHDEMTIKHDLVYDRRSGEIVGFINPEQWEGKGDNLATHVLVFMVVGVNTSLKMSLGFFSTRTVTADALYPLLWQAVGYLEHSCGLKVIASTSDKATPNQRLYRLQGQGEDVCYKAVNLYSMDRYLYFFSDAPHLMKTVRNNLASSGSGKNTRLLSVS